MNDRPVTLPCELAATHDGYGASHAVDTTDDKFLKHLDIDRFPVDQNTQSLQDSRIIVIGAGPAGLIFARAASQHGADVLVAEKNGDPRNAGFSYTDRSFNITLDNVGRQVLGDTRAFKGGIWLAGRAIHNGGKDDTVIYAPYGAHTDDQIVGIPRLRLLQNLTDLAEQAGATLLFDTRVTAANCDSGEVTMAGKTKGRTRTRADLIVFSDGLHSMTDEMTSGVVNIWPEENACFTSMVPPDRAKALSLNHIHFWHEPNGDGYTLGIPNADGSVALLTSAKFRGIGEDEHPFATPEAATKRLQQDFPSLHRQAPFLAKQLPHRKRGRFWFKQVSRYRIGDKGVIVGDAGCVFPPWAGYGANAAMYAAASLAHHLSRNPASIVSALETYEQQQLALGHLLREFVRDHSNFFSDEVKTNPSKRASQAILSTMIKDMHQNVSSEAFAITQLAQDY